jgi:hypothetical protein
MSDHPKKIYEGIFDWLNEVRSQFLAKSLSRSYAIAMRPERKARLAAILQLAVELDAIKRVSITATGLGEAVIEKIIEGDWEGAEAYVGDLSFNDESGREEDRRRWEPFVLTLRTACADARRRASSAVPSKSS